MRLRVLSLLVVLVLVPLNRAQDTVKVPTLTMRLKGLDELVADLRFLADQAGRGEEAKQVEALLKSMTGEKGLEGLDTKKPIGIYGYLGTQGIDSEVVLMLPVADEKAFVATLERLNLKGETEKGVHKIQPEGSPFPAYFRFTNGYLYGTLRDPDVISDKRLLKPAAAFPADEKDTFSLGLDLSAFPKGLREFVVGQLNLRIADLKEKKPGETQAQADFRAAALEDAVGLFKSLLSDSGSITFRFGVDRKTSDIGVSVGLAGKAGSDLAKKLTSLGQTKSTVAGIVGDDSAMATRITFDVTDGVRQGFSPVIDEALKKILADTKDPGARDLLKPLLDAIAPSLKQGRLDAALDLRGPSEKKTYTVVGAAGIKNGAALEKEIKAAVKKLPAEVADLIAVDAAKSGDVQIHKVNIAQSLDAEAKKQLGDEFLYFAVRDDALFFALGDGGLAALKDVVKVAAKATPLMQVEMSMQRVAALMEAKRKDAPKAAQEAFGKEQGRDKIVVSLEGGRELRFKFGMKGAVLRFFALLDAAEKKDQ